MTHRKDLERLGFSGFISVRELQATDLEAVPKEPGVYVFLREAPSPPKFIAVSSGGHFKGKDPTIPISKLKEKWVPESKIVYIGKAGYLGKPPTLRTRLKQSLAFGAGKPIGHWGGRYIWQLRDSAELLVCWKATENHDPEKIKREMITAFRMEHSRLPFANLTKGTKRKSCE